MTKQERISAAIFSLMSIAVIYYGVAVLKLGTIQEPGAGFFPALCGVGILSLCLIWLATARLSPKSEPLWGKGELKGPLTAAAIITAYAAGLETLGYVSSTFLFLVAWQVFIERETWRKTGLIAVIGTVVMYLLFSYLLGVPLPDGLLL